jgi:hypothetical protein
MGWVMAKRNDQFRGAVQAIVVGMVLAMIGGAVKLYNDVQELKVRFNYVHGEWSAPK